SEQAVGFVVGTSGEIEGVGRTGAPTVAEPDAPQAIDRDRPVVRTLQLAVRLPAVFRRAERVDPAVPEVADEEMVTELAEVRRRPGETPRRVQAATGGDAPMERPVRAEDADVAEALAIDL